jgi:Arc/MetJ family transcription regulator
MRTNIVLDDKLVKEAMKLTSARSKRELVDLALRELVASRKRPDLRDLFGSDLITEDYDYKAARAGRSFDAG